MRAAYIILWTIVCCNSVAQRAYFQQDLKYTIQVTLNDQTHSLQGEMQIVYQNNSPDILDKIGIHLWPNAYSTKQTAFAKQKIKHGDTGFFDAPQESLGYIDSLKFTVDGIPSRLHIDPENPDMAWLELPGVLSPGDQIVIRTPFFVQLPESFSRLGHAGQTYQITQWYPKPAVYDHKGWHLMPYLDQGEFYSEFGSFDVAISLPKNYVVGATGSLQNAEEIRFLHQKTEETIRALQNKTPMSSIIPESDSVFKTLHFKAEGVHDFAWFADKSFYVQKAEAILKSGRRVDCWTMFNDISLWDESASYVKRAIEFYSEHIGEYPWPHATAVESALSAGGGMEYPMITVIGPSYHKQSLDEVITHEIGHNWFYGILGNNERDHPFLDEGINSYYEHRYMDQYYPDFSLVSFPDYFYKLFGNFNLNQIMYLIFAREYNDQFPNQHSDNFSKINYGNDVYYKSSQLFQYAEYFTGRSVMDSLMKEYYNTWKFKHPYPEDFKSFFINHKLDWLFDGFLNSNKKMDYGFTGLKKKDGELILGLKNSGCIEAPFVISGVKNGKEIEKFNIPGFKGKRTLIIPAGDNDLLAIDLQNQSYDLYDCNNYIKMKAWFKKTEPVKLHWLPILDQNGQTDLGITPLLGWNYYNGLMLGAFLSGPWFPYKKWNLNFLPFYSFKSNTIAGQAELRYTSFFNSGPYKNLDIKLFTKRYSYNQYDSESFLNYLQIQPELELFFRHNPSESKKSSISLTAFWIQDDIVIFKDSSLFTDQFNRIDYQLRYNYSKQSILGDFKTYLALNFKNHNLSSGLHQQLLRFQFSADKKIRYKQDRYFSIRTYLAWYPYNTERRSNYISSRNNSNFFSGSSGLSFQNYLDENNEELFFGRSESSGIWSQQIAVEQGGFKLVHGAQQRSNIGNSNSFIWSVNLSADLPYRFIGNRIRPYLDIGYYEQSGLSTQEKLLFSAGINVSLIPGVFDFYLPVFHSKNINDLYKFQSNHSYWNEISFSIKLKKPGMKDVLSVLGY